jgi:hypothetical protein
MKLTAVAVRNAKAKASDYRLTDGHGLHLFVKKNGSTECEMAVAECSHNLGMSERFALNCDWAQVLASMHRRLRDIERFISCKRMNSIIYLPELCFK